MFVFMLLGILLCITLIVLIKSQFWFSWETKGKVRIICVAFAALILIIAAVEGTAYFKGGLTATETNVKISQVNIGENADFFNVNGKYWSIHGDDIATGHTMITAQNPKNMEIRTLPAESLLEKDFIISYLPISRYIIKMRVPISHSDGTTTNFDCFSSEWWNFENEVVRLVLIFAFIALICISISSLKWNIGFNKFRKKMIALRENK